MLLHLAATNFQDNTAADIRHMFLMTDTGIRQLTRKLRGMNKSRNRSQTNKM
jgi:hypothetical protein